VRFIKPTIRSHFDDSFENERSHLDIVSGTGELSPQFFDEFVSGVEFAD
jgi:hypothetical protein